MALYRAIDSLAHTRYFATKLFIVDVNLIDNVLFVVRLAYYNEHSCNFFQIPLVKVIASFFSLSWMPYKFY